MTWIPLGASAAAALLIAPSAIRSLAAGGWRRENYRGIFVAFPSGLVVLGVALAILGPLALAAEVGDWRLFEPGIGGAVAYVVVVGALGLADDTIGRSGERGSPRGWRGHLGALASGRPTTGLLKAAGTLGIAALLMSQGSLAASEGTGPYLLAVTLLVLTANFFNLLDLRPGRVEKAFVLVAAGLSVGAATLEPLRLLGLFVGPLMVIGFYNLRELSMLGDTGSNAAGAVAGIWLVTSLSTAAQAVAVATIALLSAYGEFRSLGAIVERVPLLKHLDSIGRR
jgi:UDP-GlcNAc:undecaprenyl-phosphate/decaprenyl-phosphate GlcNAc-1-phosphate transferase